MAESVQGRPGGAGSPEMAPTLEDVARLAGVSRATASRVVRGDVPVSERTASVVAQAIKDLGYSPNQAARMLVTKRSGVVGVLVPETDLRVFSDPFFAEIYHGVLSAFVDHEVRVVLAMAKPGESPVRMTDYLTSGRIEGAVVASHHGTELPRALAATSAPVVFVGDPRVAGLPYVELNHEAAAGRATWHLVERGCTRIATITGGLDMAAGALRRDGFVSAMRAAGLTPVAIEEGNFTADSGAAAVERLLASGRRFDGLFAASDLMAIAAIRTLAEHGLRVPEDVAVIGFDNTELGAATSPALTTITNPAHAMALAAGEMLRSLLAGQPIETPLLFNGDLIVRESA